MKEKNELTNEESGIMGSTLSKPGKEKLYGLPAPGETLTSILRYSLSTTEDDVMGSWISRLESLIYEIGRLEEFREMEQPIPDARIQSMSEEMAKVFYYLFMMTVSSKDIQPIVRSEFVRLVTEERKRGSGKK